MEQSDKKQDSAAVGTATKKRMTSLLDVDSEETHAMSPSRQTVLPGCINFSGISTAAPPSSSNDLIGLHSYVASPLPSSPLAVQNSFANGGGWVNDAGFESQIEDGMHLYESSSSSLADYVDSCSSSQDTLEHQTAGTFVGESEQQSLPP